MPESTPTIPAGYTPNPEQGDYLPIEYDAPAIDLGKTLITRSWNTEDSFTFQLRQHEEDSLNVHELRELITVLQIVHDGVEAHLESR